MTHDASIPSRLIKHCWSGAVLFECELPENQESLTSQGRVTRFGYVVKEAVKARISLRHADLRHADLRHADLRHVDLGGADLKHADLRHADLGGADLRGSILMGANLKGANLRGALLKNADLTGAVLKNADLAGADLMDANLERADLSESDLTGINLRDANLTRIRNDLWDVLLRARQEVPALLAALNDGKIDGSTYTGECACLVGTIANARGLEDVKDLGCGLVRDSDRPIERWFLAIRSGDTPDTSPIAAITAGWVKEFLKLTAQPEKDDES